MSYLINYSTSSVDGTAFSKIYKNIDWVEYLNKVGFVYYFTSIDNNTYARYRQHLIDSMSNYLKGKDANLGWIQHLAQQRLSANFILPLFGIVNSTDESIQIQCGASRLNANIICGVAPMDIPLIVFSKKQLINLPAGAVYLKSTEQFNTLCNLENVDYKLSFQESDTEDITFINSILRYTQYDEAEPMYFHKTADMFCRDFWKKFQSDNSNQIKIQISCTPETRQYIKYSELFDVTYIDKSPDSWVLSYGMILGEFKSDIRKKSAVPTLQLWLYDICDPVYLELLVPWMTNQCNFYMTKNEKAVIIFGNNSATSMQVIGNWLSNKY